MHILARHNIWRPREMLKPYLKCWEVLCTGLKKSKCSLLTLFHVLTLSFLLQRETHKVLNWQFLYRFPWRETTRKLCVCVLQCHIRHLFCLGNSFLTSWCNGAEIEKQMHWQISYCYLPPSACTGTNCSPPGMQWSKYCIMFIHTCDPPESPGHLWSLWAGYRAVLQSAANPPGCQRGGFNPSLSTTTLWTSPSLWFKELMQYIVLQHTLEGMCCTLKLPAGMAMELPSHCRDPHSRGFWASKWCLSLAKSTLSPLNQDTPLKIIRWGCHRSLAVVTDCCNSELFSIAGKREYWCSSG